MSKELVVGKERLLVQAKNLECKLSLLHAAKFAEIRLDCATNTPGIDESPEWRDWTKWETTPDQKRIEDYLMSLPLRQAKILHVGVGNSSLARRLSQRTDTITGLTISRQEHEHAVSLKIPNYSCLMRNKFDGGPNIGVFDFIVDNNVTTFACCWTHFSKMVISYRNMLSARGVIITDRVGLGWISSNQPLGSRWSFSEHDLGLVAEAMSLQVRPIGSYLLALVAPEVRLPTRLYSFRLWPKRVRAALSERMRRF